MKIFKRILLISILIVIALIVAIGITKAKTAEITADSLNLRQEPSMDSYVIMAIPEGEACKFIEETGDWYKVEYNGVTGYISKDYAEIKNDTEETEKPQEEQPAKPDNTKPQNTKKTSKISKETSIRILPLLSSSKIQKIEKDIEVSVISKTNGWVYIQTSSVSGWIREDCIVISESNEQNNVDEKKEDNKPEEKTETKPEEKPEEKQAENKDVAVEERTAYINEVYVNVRKGPSTDTDVIKVLTLNAELTIVAENGDWYKVESGEDTGYVAKSLVSDKKQETTSRNAEPRNAQTSNQEKIETTETTKPETTVKQEKTEQKVEKTETKPEKEEQEQPAKEEKTETKPVTTSNKGEQIVSYAKQYLGCPYVYGGSGPSSFDCSGFTMYVYNHFGVSLPHGATSQSYYGTKVNVNRGNMLSRLQLGDLIFFQEEPGSSEIGHVGIYIGNGEVIHASSGSSYCVTISSLTSGWYYDRFGSATRFF